MTIKKLLPLLMVLILPVSSFAAGSVSLIVDKAYVDNQQVNVDKVNNVIVGFLNGNNYDSYPNSNTTVSGNTMPYIGAHIPLKKNSGELYYLDSGAIIAGQSYIFVCCDYISSYHDVIMTKYTYLSNYNAVYHASLYVKHNQDGTYGTYALCYRTD